jgi:MoaA/NifB/PqqE/SkfB family radical SAM enzyme
VELTRHVDDAARRRELLAIEASLVEAPFPPQLVVENTSYCNLKCVHCSHREMIRPQRHMDRWLWEKIVREVGMTSPECEIWPTFYGESMILGRELFDRLDYASAAGCRNLVLNSNGTLLARDGNIDRILDAPLRRFILSLDGLSKEVFEGIRVKAKWEKVYPAAIELCQRRRERGLEYPLLIMQFSVMKQNAHEVEAYRGFWHAQGAEVKVRPMLEWTATGTVRTETIVHDSSFRIACPWSNSTMAVQQDGRVVACAVDYEGRYTAGDLRTESIGEVWTRLGTSLRAAQREHRWSDLPDVCRGCGDWQAAGARYEPETVAGTRPFWYYERSASRGPSAD